MSEKPEATNQGPEQATEAQAGEATQPAAGGEAKSGPPPRDPNLRLEAIIGEKLRRHRWVLVGVVAALVLVIGGCFWLRGGETAPPGSAAKPFAVAAPVAAEEVETRVAEMVAEARKEWAAALPPTPDVNALVAAARVQWEAAAAPGPAQVPGKLKEYNQYRYYHFLEEYKMCLGAQPAAVVDIAEPDSSEETATEEPGEEAGVSESEGEGDPEVPASDGTSEELPAPTPTPTPTPALEMRPELDLEIETLQALPEAVGALLNMYDSGQCLERDDYAVYRGRGTWLRRWR